MVYGFVKQSGGFVTLDSEAGSGTAVHLYLPRSSDADIDVDVDATASVPVATEVDRVLKVLFVEDDPTLRMLTGEVIAELGHQIVLSESAEDALEQLEAQPFDVLLTDVGLAGMSGIELVRQAQQRHPELALVIASGYAVDARDEGIDSLRVMLKPYDIHQVRELLDTIARERGHGYAGVAG
jgi:CheY-like chemotaxis protein